MDRPDLYFSCKFKKMRKMRFPVLVFLLWISACLLLLPKAQSQCITVESILVDACAPPSNPYWEGLNEMFRFRVGAQPINAGQIQITWANNIQFIPFNGFIQNSQTASVTASLNATVQSCGWLIEPPSLILPANSKVLVITSPMLDINANPFASLSDTMYVLYHNHAGVVYDPNYGTTVAYGHFINYNPNPAIPNIQTLSISVSSIGCNVSVSYNKSFLVTQAGSAGAQDGATVNFGGSGAITYVNNGCIAPVPVLSAAWTPPGNICPNASPLNLNTYVTGTPGGTWSGQGVTGNQFNPSGLSGPIAITYTVNPGPCAKVSTQNITVGNTGNPAWTIPANVCSGDQVSLTPLITGTTGGTWSGQGVSGSTFNSSGLSGNINITYTVGAVPCQTSSTQAISVTPRGNPAWTPPSGLCSGDVVSLNNYVTGTTGGTWSGQGVSGATFNTAGLTGNINITYTVGSGNCKDSSIRAINIGSRASASWTPPSGICSGDVVSLNNLITGTTGGTWSGQGVTGSSFNSAGLSGNIPITYKVGTGSCRDSSTQNIQVLPSGNAAWTSPGSVCNDASPIDLNTYVTGTTGGTWSGQGVSTSGTFNPAGLSGSIPITYSLGQGSCQGQSVQNINVAAFTTFPLTADKNIICAADSARVCAPTGYVSYNWNVGGTSNCVPAKNAGAYYVTVTDANGCTGESQRFNLSVYPIPPISVIVQGDTLSSFGAVSYQWRLNGTDIPGATSPVYVATQSGRYSLRVTDNNGCESTSTDVNIYRSAIGEIPSRDLFHVMQDPSFRNIIYISIPSLTQQDLLEIFNAAGQMVLSENIQRTETQIDVSFLPSGVYLLRYKDAVKKVALF